ncbi:MarR family winged helix-turn-helix transcriptional regulator [Parafrigoribacterium soli]|uniref:MarR family winged helix-turn-helix transcriptional regulator n=1 Tax=Parafrigoribacterium soli TaxID=3144663 RepID=UPI0032ED8409
MPELHAPEELVGAARAQQTTSPEITLLYLIKQVELAVRSQLDEAARAQGLTALQYTALTVLERHPELTSAELARNSFVRAQTMAQMITVLDERGLIMRQRDPNSHRQYLLSLTPEGQGILDALREAVQGIEEKMVADLTVQQSRHLREALHACRVALGGGRAH